MTEKAGRSSAKLARATPSVFDFRIWMGKAKAIGELREADHADLKFELGAISELNAKQRGPAILFRKFKGFPEEFGVLTGSMLNARTLGLTMGIEEQLDTIALTERIVEKLRVAEEKAKDYPAEYVDDGPVMENKATGDDVDLTIFPTPLYHELDGGPYIGTGSVLVMRDPDSSWVNVGAYRIQRLSKNALGNYIAPGHHGNIIRQKYWDKDQPCPVVAVFGSHPLILALGGFEIPYGEDEFNWIGATLGQRVPVIRGPITKLPIPADAEIAVEGFITKGDLEDEGPFGEFTGYYAGRKGPQPVIRVKAVYYRNQPTMLGMVPCRPVHDFTYYFSVLRSASIKEFLRKAGVPGVKSVWASEAGASRNWIVTSIEQKYAGHAAQVANLAAQCPSGGLMNRYSIVVDEDIDPSNNDDVIWALSTRSDPAADIDILRHCWSSPLDPVTTTAAKERKDFSNNRAIINACKPWDRLKANDFPPVAEANPELLKATKKKWAWLLK